jgi:glycosyltransferase involved in cell wall biosynthesis
MTRLLYILPGLVPPSSDSALDKFKYLSEIAEGEVLLPVWWDSPKSVPPFVWKTFPAYRVGNFCYRFFLSERFPKPLRRLATLFFYLRCGIQLHRGKKFDFIMTYGTNLPGIAGVILKWITGVKLIIEIPGVPEDAFRYEVARPGRRAAIKRFFADQLLLLVGAAADCIKLLYPGQLWKYPRLREKNVVVFHDFVPVDVIASEEAEEKFILSAGSPWYRKGIDVLIRAFESIAAKFPDYKLKLMGYYPDREFLDKLAGNCPQIEFLTPRSNELALKVIGSCSVFVLASRSEAMGRVLLEAMAARKPIIASAVDGVPHYIRDNDNGLLFQSENVEELAGTLAKLLSNPALQACLAKGGYEKVFSEFDERSYVREFRSMLESMGSETPSGHRDVNLFEETTTAAKSTGLRGQLK